MKKLLLLSFLAVAIVSCEDAENTSVVTTFEKYPVTNAAAPIELAEFSSNTYTFDFSTDERQITDIHLQIEVGSSSTATEGEDFILETHSVDLLAFGGQEGFTVNITVLDDVEPEGDETIYLKFSSEDPSGVDETEALVLTIKGCTEPEAADDLFVGDYVVTSSPGSDPIGGGAPVFDEPITLSFEGSGTRSFSATYYGVFGIGNPPQEWTLKFDACNGNGFVFRADDTNLGCGTPAIRIIPLAPFGTTNITDDSEFTVVIAEYEPEICGADGTESVTLTFTKL